MPGKKPALKSAFDIPATEHPVSSPKNARRQKPARSSDAFANLIATPQPDLGSPSAMPSASSACSGDTWTERYGGD